jgi:hypothetical protein
MPLNVSATARAISAPWLLGMTADELEARYDRQFKAVFDAIRQLMTPPPSSQR